MPQTLEEPERFNITISGNATLPDRLAIRAHVAELATNYPGLAVNLSGVLPTELIFSPLPEVLEDEPPPEQ